MSILIKGMEMPTSCFDCYFCTYGYCGLKDDYTEDSSKRRNDCPLIPVPPHGRLIDADAFDERVRLAGGMADEELTDDFKDGIQTTLLMLKTQRTIIPASREAGE